MRPPAKETVSVGGFRRLAVTTSSGCAISLGNHSAIRAGFGWVELVFPGMFG